MEFEVSGITNKGTVRSSNQDRILVNGQLLSEGEIHHVQQGYCRCFVADGVGGNRAGEVAANYVLEKIDLIPDLSNANFEPYLARVNKDFLTLSNSNAALAGAATTLTGLLVSLDEFCVIHCGDSQLWLLRNGIMFRITKEHVLDEYQENSPITSFFGGTNDNLRFDKQIFVDRSISGDTFLICSDGLFKSLDKESVKAVLQGGGRNQTKSQDLLKRCLISGAEDNVSIVLIERID